jgi:hypothetical protein
MLLLSVLVPIASAACSPSTATALSARVDEAMGAMEQLDQGAFHSAETALLTDLECLTETVPRSLAAGIHRVVGIGEYLDHNTDGAERAFAAARTIEPAWHFPSAIAPAGHPLLTAWEARPVGALASTPLPSPETGDVLLDGRSARTRATDLPAIFQRGGEDGSITQTTYLAPTDPVPAYPVAVVVSATTTTPLKARHTSVPIAAIAGASAAAAIGTYAVAGVYAGDYRSNDHTGPELDALRSKANSLSVTAAGIGGVALGLGVTAVLVGRW